MTHYNFGQVLTNIGKHEQAIDHYNKALRNNPNYAMAHYNLGNIYMALGKPGQAIYHYQETLRIDPYYAIAHNNLAWMLATVEDEKLRDPAEAVRFAKRACELTQYSQPGFLDTLTVAYAASGDFPKAIETAEKTLLLIDDNEELTHKVQKRIDLYKANKPDDNK